MRVAIVHDWLTGFRGGEKVLEVFCELFPEAPLYTLFHIPDSTSPTIESHPIRTAFTQRLPGSRSHYRWYLPLYPLAIESLDLEGYDLVLSSSHCAAKGIIPPPDALHICYCHTPMRYIWDRFEDYFGTGAKARFVFGPIAHFLRDWDVSSSRRVDHFVANSDHVADRIRTYYGRDVDEVIPPPVDTSFFTPGNGGSSTADDYFLIVSALVPYKRVELAIQAFTERRDPLLIVGTGPERARLEAFASDNVRFLGRVDDEELRRLYRNCRACLLPGVEDFGIVPLEAQACGRPVVALARGGALETVRNGETGVLFEEASADSISRAVDKVSTLSFNSVELCSWAKRFSRESFKSKINEFITNRTGARS